MQPLKQFLTGALLVTTTIGAATFSHPASAAEIIIRPSRTVRVVEPIRVVRPVRVIEPVPVFAPDAYFTPLQPGYLPPAYYTPSPVAEVQLNLPSIARTTWENSEVLYNNQGWVESTMPVNQEGKRLLLKTQGTSQLEMAEVKFGDGQIQRIYMQNLSYSDGEYPILDFGSKRYVESVRLVARAESPETNLTVKLRT